MRRASYLNPGFQSAPPVKGATLVPLVKDGLIVVSIRAPREGGDKTLATRERVPDRFNPRPP